MVVPVISIVEFSQKHVLKVEFLQKPISDIFHENSNANQNGSGGPGPK